MVEYVDVEIVGSIMSSPSMSDLATYVRMMAKMITCRDILKKEWLNLLDYLEKRKRNSTTRDPVESLWELVNGLAGSESRSVYFRPFSHTLNLLILAPQCVFRRIEVFTENGSLITEFVPSRFYYVTFKSNSPLCHCGVQKQWFIPRANRSWTLEKIQGLVDLRHRL